MSERKFLLKIIGTVDPVYQRFWQIYNNMKNKCLFFSIHLLE